MASPTAPRLLRHPGVTGAWDDHDGDVVQEATRSDWVEFGLQVKGKLAG